MDELARAAGAKQNHGTRQARDAEVQKKLRPRAARPAWPHVNPQKINRLSVLILALGFTAAVVLWFVMPPPDSDGWRDDPLNQKRNRRQLAVIGGQANQLSADFIEWFGERWEGRNLAYTVGFLTLVAMGGFRFVAVRMEPPADEPGKLKN